jgi:hypothetical protein
MSEMSNYLENGLLNAVLRNTSYSSPTTVYVGLYTTDPGEGNTGTEISGNSYARKDVTFNAPSNGVCTNSAAVEFAQATGSWGTVSHVGLLDAITSGNLLFYTDITTSKTIESGDIFKIAAGSLSVTLA